MARACPSCGRPNADGASKCLYCTAALSAPALPPAKPPRDVSEDMERHLVILLPAGEPGPETVRELARIAELSLYDARMSLTGRRPRVFRKLSGADPARQLSRDLAAARIPHYVVAEASVLSLPVARVKRLDLHERHLSLALDEGLVSMAYDDLLLLVRGEIEREQHREKRLGSTRGVSRRLTPGLRLHVYVREASVAAEIDPATLDWDALGEARTASALLNLQQLLARLAERAPAVELDRGFDDEPAVLSRSGADEDVARALVAKERPGQGVVYDNEAQFRYYSRWRYRLCRHLATRNAATA